jgi:hypothetical protein
VAVLRTAAPAGTIRPVFWILTKISGF